VLLFQQKINRKLKFRGDNMPATTRQEIASSVYFEEIDNQNILIITVETTNRASIESWANWITSRIHSWDEHKPYLVMYDLTHPKAVFTPHMRQASEKAFSSKQAVTGRIAVLMKKDIRAQFISIFVRMLPKRAREARIFFDREEALAWLRAGKKA
jgi:hypothetical protein